MTPTIYRDQVAQLAKTDPDKAIKIADKIDDPWFQAQAWSHLARHAQEVLTFAQKSSNAAANTKDEYQRSAVRAWEIAALAERQYFEQARNSLIEAVELAVTVPQIGSRAEALILLFAAAFKISREDANSVAQALERSCAADHWRAKRARKFAASILNGEMLPREFFW